jgi:hypothetical protein
LAGFARLGLPPCFGMLFVNAQMALQKWESIVARGNHDFDRGGEGHLRRRGREVLEG